MFTPMWLAVPQPSRNRPGCSVYRSLLLFTVGLCVCIQTTHTHMYEQYTHTHSTHSHTLSLPPLQRPRGPHRDDRHRDDRRRETETTSQRARRGLSHQTVFETFLLSPELSVCATVEAWCLPGASLLPAWCQPAASLTLA